MQTEARTWTGIAGVLHLDGAPSFDVSVAAMARAIAHRGLAGASVTTSGALQLAAAHASADLLVVIDGQTAPAEVARLYQQHGLGFVDHLDGGFAVAVWDARERRLVLARDCAGVRPLFVARPRPGLLLFGSEVKALLAHPECPRAVDWLGTLARDALAFRRSPPTSYFQGIDPVAPGTLLLVAGRDVETRRFWSLARVDDATDRRSDAELIAGYGDTLRAAVVTATADAAPPALFLSGGVDSIAIAALGRASRPTTFTVLSRSTFGNGDAGLARDAAAHLELVHHAVPFRRGDAGRTIDWWRQLVWTVETPHCRAQHYLKSELARAAAALAPDTRVLLHGEGSDELIGADPANWNDASGELTYDDYLAQLAVQQRDAWVSEGSLAVEKYFATRVFNEDFLGARADLHPLERRALYCLDALADDVLWRDDRLAAAHGLQARAPFLDRRVLDYVAGIPRRAYRSLFWKKRVLRDGLAAELPERFRWQPKVPFYAGADVRFTNRLLLDLLVADGHALVHEALGDLDRHPVLAPGFIAGLLADAVRDPSANAVHDLLVFVNLGLLERMTRAPHAPPMPPVTALATWRDDEVEALLAEPGDALDLGRVLRLGVGVELARPCADETVLWIVVDDQVRYVVGDAVEWRAVLGRVDGVRPLAALLAEAGVTLAQLRKHLDEALEFQVVAFV